MKKKTMGLLVGAMACMLVACGSEEKEDKTVENGAQKLEIVTTESAEETVQEEVQEENEEEIYVGGFGQTPWVDSDQAGVLDATGFHFVAPEEAANVGYSYMPSTGMAQMNFTTGDAMWVYRAKPADALEDISDISCDWDITEETTIAGMEAMEYSYASPSEDGFLDDMEVTRVHNWFDAENKVTYSLSVIGKNLNGMDTSVYAENLFYAN